MKEKTVNTKYIYNGRILNLRNDDIVLPNGKSAMREVVEHSGGATVLAIDTEDNVYLVKQFRYPYKKFLYELPAGKLNKGEPPELCAKRELKEETGLIAENLTLLGELYPSPGYTEEIIYMYLAEGLIKGTASPDEDEFLDIVKIPFNDLLAKIISNDIKDAKTITAFLLYCVSKRLN